MATADIFNSALLQIKDESSWWQHALTTQREQGLRIKVPELPLFQTRQMTILECSSMHPSGAFAITLVITTLDEIS